MQTFRDYNENVLSCHRFQSKKNPMLKKEVVETPIVHVT